MRPLHFESTSHPCLENSKHIRCTSTDLIETCRKELERNGHGGPGGHWWHQPGESERWDLGLGIKKSLELATYGVASEAPHIRKLAEKVGKYALEYEETALLPAQAGPLWDIPAVIAGHPYCAYRFGETRTPRLVKLVVNCFYSAGVDAGALRNRARAITALALALHTEGYALECELVNGMKISPSGLRIVMETVVHTPGEVFDTERLAFWLGHPAAVRNLVYGGEATLTGSDNGKQLDEFPENMAAKCKAEGWVYIGAMHLYADDASITACATPEGALNWIQKQLDYVRKGDV